MEIGDNHGDPFLQTNKPSRAIMLISGTYKLVLSLEFICRGFHDVQIRFPGGSVLRVTIEGKKT